MRLELVVGQRTKGRRGTNLTRELRPIDALMMDQAAERARATMRCFLKGESLYMTPGRKGQPRPGKEGGSIYGRVRMACPARSWDGMLRVTFQSLQGVAQRTKPTSQRVRRLVWYSYIFMLLCTSFLFRKLLGVALLAAGKKRDASHMVDFIGSQNCGSRIRRYPRQVVLWICTEIAAGHSGEIPFSRPRVTWVARRQASSLRQKLFSQSLMDKDCTCLRNTEFLTG